MRIGDQSHENTHTLLKRDKKRGYKEPWLLVSSLPKRHNFLEKVLKLYGMRMQIEAGFRDQKSVRFGLGSDLHRTNKFNHTGPLVLNDAWCSDR